MEDRLNKLLQVVVRRFTEYLLHTEGLRDLKVFEPMQWIDINVLFF
jgi:hypothetical protein